MENEMRGVVVLDASGEVRFASGIGSDSRLLRDLSKRWAVAP